MDVARHILGEHPGGAHRAGLHRGVETQDQYKRAPVDYRGAVLIAAGIALIIFGLQQSALWSWSNPWTWICIVVGLAIIGVFVLVELRTASPLIQVSIFRVRPSGSRTSSG